MEREKQHSGFPSQRAVLIELEGRLWSELDDIKSNVMRRWRVNGDELGAVHDAAIVLHRALTLVHDALSEGSTIDMHMVESQINQLATAAVEAGRTAQDRHARRASVILNRTARLLTFAHLSVFPMDRTVVAPKSAVRATDRSDVAETHDRKTVRTLEIHAEQLYHFQHATMPPERMFVVAGRIAGNRAVLGSAFEVTGTSSGGHCQADPSRLGRALIAMANTETVLALWLHSHPGLGANATHPSNTDLRQHKEWIVDYSPRLVSAITVSDGYIRLWGDAIEQGSVRPEIVGPGVEVAEREPQILIRLDE
jgi:proteasome lid subunit RPN8/RPN11